MKKIAVDIPRYIKSIVDLEEKQRYSTYSYPEIQNNDTKIEKLELTAGLYNFLRGVLPVILLALWVKQII